MSGAAETWPFQVRVGFVLRLGKRLVRGGEIVDLTEDQAVAHRHMVEPAPDQVEPEKPKQARRDR